MLRHFTLQNSPKQLFESTSFFKRLGTWNLIRYLTNYRNYACKFPYINIWFTQKHYYSLLIAIFP